MERSHIFHHRKNKINTSSPPKMLKSQSKIQSYGCAWKFVFSRPSGWLSSSALKGLIQRETQIRCISNLSTSLCVLLAAGLMRHQSSEGSLRREASSARFLLMVWQMQHFQSIKKWASMNDGWRLPKESFLPTSWGNVLWIYFVLFCEVLDVQ